jgi:hypothetical protein
MRGTTFPASSRSSSGCVRICWKVGVHWMTLGVQEAANPTYLLAWIPDSLLNSRGEAEYEKWTKVEEHAVVDEEDEGERG